MERKFIDHTQSYHDIAGKEAAFCWFSLRIILSGHPTLTKEGGVIESISIQAFQ